MVFLLTAKKQRPRRYSELFHSSDWNLPLDLTNLLGMRVPRERAARMKYTMGCCRIFSKGREMNFFEKPSEGGGRLECLIHLYLLHPPKEGPVLYRLKFFLVYRT